MRLEVGKKYWTRDRKHLVFIYDFDKNQGKNYPYYGKIIYGYDHDLLPKYIGDGKYHTTGAFSQHDLIREDKTEEFMSQLNTIIYEEK